MKREFECVRFLGLHLDRRLNWSRHISIIERNATRAYVLIYNRFKNSRAISADWVSTMMRSFVLSKISFLAEVWTNTTKRILLPMAALYKRMVRFCQRASLSSPVLYDCMIGEWPSWQEWVDARKASLFTRVLRTPETNILCDRVSSVYWRSWLRERGDEKRELKGQLGEDVEFDHGVDLRVKIVKAFDPMPELDDRLCRVRGKGDEAWKPKSRGPRPIRGPLFATFEINKRMLSSDYVCLAGLVSFDQISKRLSYHEPMLELPQNACFHNWDYVEEEQLRYSDECSFSSYESDLSFFHSLNVLRSF